MAKIPAHAKKVFSGVIFDIYQWEQEMFDGSKATFEMAKRPNTVIVIPMQGETVFYAKQEQPSRPPFLSLFGGRGEEGEDPLETAKRELLEETGMVSDDWHLIRHYESLSKLEWNRYVYVAKNCRQTEKPNLDAGEKIEVCSTSLDKLITEVMTDPNFAEFELQQELLSALSPAAIAKLKKDIIG